MAEAVDQGIDARTGQPVGQPVPHNTPEELAAICAAARDAAPWFARTPLPERAAMLRAVAGSLERERDAIVRLADTETGLGEVRLSGELTRTRVQLEMFADAVLEGSFLDIMIDPADPDARPAPRPDLRRMLVPLGPVAVFAAGNFPLAFSVAGGDPASALAAGCPVVVKAHPGHPGTSVLCARVVARALSDATDAPDGAFALVQGLDAGRDLVRHPAIRAVGFTGSAAGGRALFELCAARPDPIPFYGELGAVNPVVVTRAALAGRGAEIAAGIVASFTLGSGQFCTKPGLLFLPAGHDLSGALVDALRRADLGPMLGARFLSGYRSGAARMSGASGVRTLLAPEPDRLGPTLLAVPAGTLSGPLLDECFGPVSLIVEYESTEQLLAALAGVPGSLTASLHASLPADRELCRAVLDAMTGRAGRVVWGGWPTGVAVTRAMHHGGPWPATTAPGHTSVGVTAVRRWQRPVVYQDVPDELLPEELRAANPLRLPRRIDGALPGTGEPA